MNPNHAIAALETVQHIQDVRNNLNVLIRELINRGQNHDQSKLESPEFEIFGEHTHKLKDVAYGKAGLTEEYKELLKLVQPAIDNHWAKNRHHPEHFANGIEDMTLVDLIEMLCDWCSATKRNRAGNINQSLATNVERYGISAQLKHIFENTIRQYFP